MREAPFDNIAAGYDTEFTNSYIGQLQRERVYFLLEKLFSKQQIHQVLELNCGTGQDALWLSQQGKDVLATDISTKMLQVAQKKGFKKEEEPLFECQQLTISEKGFKEFKSEGKFDLIFSDFGGLNCVSPIELRAIAPFVSRLLKPGGYFVVVIMSRFSFWETIYFSLKGAFEKAWRRRTKKPLLAPLDEDTFVETWYYQPKEFYTFFKDYFDYQNTNSVGFFLPPSYLDNWFKKRTKFTNLLNKLEYSVPSGAFIGGASDHYILQMRKKA